MTSDNISRLNARSIELTMDGRRNDNPTFTLPTAVERCKIKEMVDKNISAAVSNTEGKASGT